MTDGGDKPLTNADFRKILFTPRPGSKPDLAQQAKEQRKEQNRNKPRPKPKHQGGGGAGRGVEGNSDDDDGPSYRDRAAERRKGLGTEHADDFDAAGFPSTVASAAAGPGLSHLSYEETKYLGGDVEHTHLVKGLDFALLSKVRSEQTQQGADGENAGQAVSFAGPMGRAVYNILFRFKNQAAVQENVAERFLPRRTAFVFNIEEQKGMKDVFEVPTTLLRAREDCPAPPKILEASSDAVVLDRLGKIMAYMAMGSSGGGGKQKLKKERKQELLAEAGFIQPTLPAKKSSAEKEEEKISKEKKVIKPVDEDEDIFADAGTDYVVERRKVSTKDDEDMEAGEAKAEEKKRSKYFGADAPTALEGGDLPPIAQPLRVSVTEADEAEEKRKAKEREARHREMLASVGAVEDDGYAECYPSYYDAAGMVYDSEDDDGTGVAKTKAGDGEEGEGVEGGKGAKDKGLAARKEAARLAMKEKQKEEAELNKLQKVFEEKGYGNAKAFGVKKNSNGGGGEKGDGAAAEAAPGALPQMPTAKRRRI